MESRELKEGVYGRLADVAKALAHPSRVELVELLAQAERPVEWLARETGMSVANTSRHLQSLRSARLVASRRSGTFVWYRLAGPEVERLLVAVRGVADALDAEVERLLRAYFSDRSGLEVLGPEALVERVARGEVLVVDVRPTAEFDAGHLPGARSIPIDRLADAVADLPTDLPIVAYCRGPVCVFADRAVTVLRAAGLRADRLSVGLPEWRAAGLPVERSGVGTPA